MCNTNAEIGGILSNKSNFDGIFVIQGKIE